MRPKWSLTHPNGRLMVDQALRSFSGCSNIERVYVVVLRSHLDNMSEEDLSQSIYRAVPNAPNTIVVLEEETMCQPMTVYRAIKQANIEGAIYIKDVDNSFQDFPQAINSVAISDLHDTDSINAGNKSYVEVNDSGMITNIVEKEIISSTFCVGGYSFASADEYCRYFTNAECNYNFYLSHMIYDMLLDGHTFKASKVEDYSDWGTLKDWDKYKSEYVTIFSDIDGVLVKNSGQYTSPKWGETGAIAENVDCLNDLYDSGKARIILTTSRGQDWKEKTEKQLSFLGVKYHDIIYGLPHSKRIIINDYAKTNPYKSCEAINIERDSNNLADMIKYSMRG
jgi:hypothetical protein